MDQSLSAEVCFGPVDIPVHDDYFWIPIRSIMPPLGTDFREKVNQFEAAGAKTIILWFNTPGGHVFEAAEIIETIKSHRSKTRFIGIVSGQCSSAGVSILQECDLRQIGSESFLMIHGMTAQEWPSMDFATIRSESNLLSQIEEMEIKRMSRSNVTPEKWRQIFKASAPTYLSAKEALAWELVDEILT